MRRIVNTRSTDTQLSYLLIFRVIAGIGVYLFLHIGCLAQSQRVLQPCTDPPNVVTQIVRYGDYIYGSADLGKIGRYDEERHTWTFLCTGHYRTYNTIAVIRDTLVVVGNTGVAAYTTDGLRWHDITLPIRGDLFVLASTSETVFVASSDGGIYAASGILSDDWEVANTADINTWTNACSVNDTVVFVGKRGTVSMYDGITRSWKSGPPSSNTTSYYACARIQPGEWAVVGDSGLFRMTTDFVSWAEEERVIPIKQIPGHPQELMRVDALSQIHIRSDGQLLLGGHGYLSQVSVTDKINTYGIHVRIAKGMWRTAYFNNLTDSGYYVHNVHCRGIVNARNTDNIIAVVSSAVNARGNIAVYAGNVQDTVLQRTSLLMEGAVIAQGNRGYLNEFVREYVSGVAMNDSTFFVGVTMKNVSAQQEIVGMNNYVLRYQVLSDTLHIDTSLILPDTVPTQVLMVRKGSDVLVATATNALIRSRDGGQTWPDTVVITGYTGSIVKLNASDDRIVVCLRDSARSVLLYSGDDGRNWNAVDFGVHSDTSVYAIETCVDEDGVVRILYKTSHPTEGGILHCSVLDGTGRLRPQEPELPDSICADQPFVTSTFGKNPFSFTAVVQKDGVYQPIVMQLDRMNATWKIVDPVFRDEMGSTFSAFQINGSVLNAGFQSDSYRATTVRGIGNVAVAGPQSDMFSIIENQMTAKSTSFSCLIPLNTSLIGVSRFYGPIQYFVDDVTSARVAEDVVPVSANLNAVNILHIPRPASSSIIELTSLHGQQIVLYVSAGLDFIDVRDFNVPSGTYALSIRQESDVVNGLILVVH